MTNKEFPEWLTEHKKMFPHLSGWLGRLGMQMNGVLAIWMDCLKDVPLNSAIEASRRLWEMEAQPKTYERHPVEVRRIAKRTTSNAKRQIGPTFDGTVKCLRCRDVGLVTVFYWRRSDVDEHGTVIRTRNVFDRMAIAEMVLDEGHERDLRTACVRCDCESGERYQNHPVWRDFCLASVCSASWRREQRFWENVVGVQRNMAGANSTRSVSEMANSDWREF